MPQPSRLGVPDVIRFLEAHYVSSALYIYYMYCFFDVRTRTHLGFADLQGKVWIDHIGLGTG